MQQVVGRVARQEWAIRYTDNTRSPTAVAGDARAVMPIKNRGNLLQLLVARMINQYATNCRNPKKRAKSIET
jgi:hypothetical protein